MYSFFTGLIHADGLVVKVSCSNFRDMGSILAVFWNSLPPLGHFALHWASQCTDTRAFTLLRSIIFVFLDLVKDDLALTTLNVTIWFPLFGAFGIGPWARIQPHVLAWRMGVTRRDYSYSPGAKVTEKAWPLLSLNWRKNLKNCGPLWGFFNSHPPDWRLEGIPLLPQSRTG